MTAPTVQRLVICGETEAACECVLAPDHDGAHECDTECGGAWEFDDRGRFHIVRLALAGRVAQTVLGDEW